VELTVGIIIAVIFFILWWIRRASRRPYTQKEIRQVRPDILKELLSHADRINDYFRNAVRVWIFAHEESARKASLSAAKVAADLQRQSMVNYLLGMSTDLSKEMGDEAAPICRLLKELVSDICEKDWTVADATFDRVELAKMDKEFADALDRADPRIFEKRYPHLFA
jgi:hypothetical protein